MREGQRDAARAYPEAGYTLSNAERSRQSQKKLLLVTPVSSGLAFVGVLLAWLWKRYNN
jgi:hypothetical protein